MLCTYWGVENVAACKSGAFRDLLVAIEIKSSRAGPPWVTSIVTSFLAANCSMLAKKSALLPLSYLLGIETFISPSGFPFRLMLARVAVPAESVTVILPPVSATGASMV